LDLRGTKSRGRKKTAYWENYIFYCFQNIIRSNQGGWDVRNM